MNSHYGENTTSLNLRHKVIVVTLIRPWTGYRKWTQSLWRWFVEWYFKPLAVLLSPVLDYIWKPASFTAANGRLPDLVCVYGRVSSPSLFKSEAAACAETL